MNPLEKNKKKNKQTTKKKWRHNIYCVAYKIFVEEIEKGCKGKVPGTIDEVIRH